MELTEQQLNELAEKLAPLILAKLATDGLPEIEKAIVQIAARGGKASKILRGKS